MPCGKVWQTLCSLVSENGHYQVTHDDHDENTLGGNERLYAIAPLNPESDTRILGGD